ncbi:hypothetical protein CBR_g23951 [Chara braunii]|uniref:Hexosyltransferase n=1 Tax=Chara braunii TaxID=69332 RepID=A0A388L5C9_CHABU|nr:hypothetical protein CBR_g23951 [Chara braunii]|eukprot:GBG77506.1 hypothetical protein CBR_g23951 [Chara braunii]
MSVWLETQEPGCMHCLLQSFKVIADIVGPRQFRSNYPPRLSDETGAADTAAPKYPGWELWKGDYVPHVDWIDDPAMKQLRKTERAVRQEARVAQLLNGDEEDGRKIEESVMQLRRIRQIPTAQKRTPWRMDPTGDAPDHLIRLIRDQAIMGRAYMAIALQRGMRTLAKDLRQSSKEMLNVIGDATVDSELDLVTTADRMRAMGHLLKFARRQLYNPELLVKKMRTVVQSTEDQIRAYQKTTIYLREQAAKAFPKGLHCLSLQLTVDYDAVKAKKGGSIGRVVAGSEGALIDNDLFHYCLFTDNVLAAAVVVNSTITNCKESRRHVFHLVTDSLNLRAMQTWFADNPPGDATLEIQNIDDFTWLNASYCPVLKQLKDESTKDYFFGGNAARSISGGANNLKYRNPKYLSMLNHVRFYLPELYPKLNKILFLDDDIVVRRDLSPLWDIDMEGRVNGAVYTCGESFHRFDKYLNFSDPLIYENFKPDDCGWAYGMNMFDLQQWKVHNITQIYHSWQEKNKDRTLWKLGTLPPGLITFYKTTFPLNNTWHVLGLGYDPNLDDTAIESAAVVHWNGNMKPWLDTAISKYRVLWAKYVDYGNERLLRCNIQAPPEAETHAEFLQPLALARAASLREAAARQASLQ